MALPVKNVLLAFALDGWVSQPISQCLALLAAIDRHTSSSSHGLGHLFFKV